MNVLEKVYSSGLGEPLHWITLTLFQPARLPIEQEPTPWRQRAGRLLRLSMFLFPLAVLLVMLARVALPAHLLDLGGDTHLRIWVHWLVPLIGITFGLLLGVLFGTIWSISFGVIAGLTASVVFGLPGNYAMLHTDAPGAWLVPAIGVAAGLALALSFGPAWGLAFGLIVGLAAGLGIAGPDLPADFVIGLGFSRTLTVRGSMISRLEISMILGGILGVIGGLTVGPAGGLAGGLAAGLGSSLGLYGGASSRADA